jgi:hypothetical protein
MTTDKKDETDRPFFDRMVNQSSGSSPNPLLYGSGFTMLLTLTQAVGSIARDWKPRAERAKPIRAEKVGGLNR